MTAKFAKQEKAQTHYLSQVVWLNYSQKYLAYFVDADFSRCFPNDMS